MKKNGQLPGKIFVYRDGVGDGQLAQVRDYEVDQIKEVFKQVYGSVETLWYVLAGKAVFCSTVCRISTNTICSKAHPDLFFASFIRKLFCV